MKKNLRIVSAAAAALLAVAPVAAAAVAQPANAAVSIPKTDNLQVNNVNGIRTYTVNYSSDDDFKSIDVPQSILDDIKKSVLPSSENAKNWEVQVLPKSLKGSRTTNEDGSETINQTFKYILVHKSAAPVAQATLNTIANNVAGHQVAGSISGHTVNAVAARHTGNLQVDNKNVEGTIGLTGKVAKTTVTEAKDVHFIRTDNHAIADNTTVVANEDQNAFLFKDKKGNARKNVTVAEVKAAIENVLFLERSYNDDSTKVVNGNWSRDVWSNATAYDNIIGQLNHAGFNVVGEGATAHFATANNPQSFQIRIQAKKGAQVTVQFQNSYAKDTTSPVIYGKYGKDWRRIDSAKGYVDPVIIPENDLANNSAWEPQNYIRVQENSVSSALIPDATFTGSVDLTKPGLYYVEVKATNTAKKSIDKKVPVIVTDINGKIMTTVKDATIYALSNDGKTMDVARSFDPIVAGTQLHTFDTKTINGVEYYRVVSPKANYWVRADVLKNGVTTPSTTQEQTTTKTVMHISTIYDKNGVATHEPALRAYDSVSVVSTPVTINGAKFYKLAGKDQYIKVGNIDGTSRTLKHNAYVYKSNGKARMASKKHHVVRKSGSSITTFGKSFMINGSQMYRVGRNQYIKKANFR